MVLFPSKMVLPPSKNGATSILDGATSGDGLGAVLISRSQPKILRKIQKKLRGYIPAIPRFLHVCRKYVPFVTDITENTTTVNCFEIGSTGFIIKSNRSTLSTLHSFTRKDLKKSTFLSNLNALAWYGSYKNFG